MTFFSLLEIAICLCAATRGLGHAGQVGPGSPTRYLVGAVTGNIAGALVEVRTTTGGVRYIARAACLGRLAFSAAVAGLTAAGR